MTSVLMLFSAARFSQPLVADGGSAADRHLFPLAPRAKPRARANHCDRNGYPPQNAHDGFGLSKIDAALVFPVVVA
jgi:hypothetical protein